MKTGAIILLILCAPAAAAAGQTLPICERIQNWDGQIAERQATITRLLRTYTEQHPEVVSARTGLASLEAARAADINRARSQGLSCAPLARPESAEAPKEKVDAATVEQ